MPGVDEAAFAVRFTSTVQGEEAEPQVLAPLHNCAGFASEQAYLLLFDWAVAQQEDTTIDNISEVHLTAKHRFMVIVSSQGRFRTADSRRSHDFSSMSSFAQQTSSCALTN
jgi:hypothetical protein